MAGFLPSLSEAAKENQAEQHPEYIGGEHERCLNSGKIPVALIYRLKVRGHCAAQDHLKHPE